GGEAHLPSGTIEPNHFAEAIAEPMPMGLGEVVHLIFAGIDAACRYRMQERLPDVGAGTIDQSDRGPPTPAEPVAEPGDKLYTRRAAADHDDAVKFTLTGRVWHA